MRITYFAIIFCTIISFGATKDTLVIDLQTEQYANSPIILQNEKMYVGVWNAKNKITDNVIIWFHGGMSSANCQKGLIAGEDLSHMLNNYTVISPSACSKNHWVTEPVIKAIDTALDSLETKYKSKIQKISLVGISDGSLGVIAYSLWGKRNISKRLLMSSYGGNLGEASEIAAQNKLQNGSWLFMQGGLDRLYPSNITVPWINEFCKHIHTNCNLKFDNQGEHDWSYWQRVHKDWILDFFTKAP